MSNFVANLWQINNRGNTRLSNFNLTFSRHKKLSKKIDLFEQNCHDLKLKTVSLKNDLIVLKKLRLKKYISRVFFFVQYCYAPLLYSYEKSVKKVHW